MRTMPATASARGAEPPAFFAGLAIEEVRLRVRDLDRARAFYRDALGLVPVRGPAAGPERALALSADGARPALVVLESDPAAPTAPRGAAGLFHVAFLYPDRPALARAVGALAARGFLPLGASDHGVSEAVYFTDPEGNGVELYADRPPDRWPRRAGQLDMHTAALDLRALLAETTADTAGRARAAGVRIGHLHLAVEDLDEARRVFVDGVGLAVSQDSYAGALFLGDGGYHHHVAVNRWHGGRPPPPAGSAGLVSFVLRRPGAAGPDFPGRTAGAVAGFTARWSPRAVAFARP